MTCLGGLWKGRGRRFSASVAVPRHGPHPTPTDRLAMDRLAVAVGLTSADAPTLGLTSADSPASSASPASHSAAWLELADRVPQPMSVPPPPLQADGLGGALGGPGLVVPPPAVQAPVVQALVVEAPAVQVPAVLPDAGRHRGAAEPLADLVPQPSSAARPPLDARAPGGAHRGPVPGGSEVVVPEEVLVPEVLVPEVLVPEVLVPVVPGGGRHRRPASSKPANRPVALGVLVLLVALAAVLGAGVVSALTSVRAQSVAAAAHAQPGGPVVESRADQSPLRYGVL